ncbi:MULTISPECIES: ADP-ribosylglycohydrolase family protein [Nostoc]|uniref:ADP-ribosylglycohydrolase family protein n=1 Tax=Nostoc paludosum FACHB-159 TaxID=2692908 RepID=A0ABR8KB34_9NOSO|nr:MULTISPECIES: ADP-ribosylglycohydrolase family protein [Nostoc]MBD2680354.1 ADP-ribosylglycohydrolase family protein [Nostoc sp. FACHB-857]MBD2736742.1 ADP-ribosylglycohydrolase family protein [Nostoc paludosum FACHB-159]
MRYSLISRFRGTLLGAFLGGSLTSGGIQPQNYPDFGRMAILGIQSLISLGRLDLDDWIARQQQASLHLAPTDMIIATLPVALFFHENPIKLRKNLLRVLKIWDDDPVVRDGTLAVGYAIALALNEKLDPLTLIPQTISFLQETPTSIPKKLLRIQDLLAQGAGLERVQAEFAGKENLSNTIAMAFYCFVSTLEDFRLAVLRATKKGDSKLQDATNLMAHSTGAITAALSGAHNTTAGIPLNWRVLLLEKDSPASELTSFDEMLELADALVAVWSGLYDNVPLDPKELTQEGCALSRVALLSVYAAPRVIKLR